MAILVQPQQKPIPNLKPNLSADMLQLEDGARDGFNNLGDYSNTYINTWTNTARLINGQGGDDSITTGGGNDEIYGGSGNDTIKSGSGWDELYGGSGNDVLLGEDGNDTLYGGSGNDVLNGGLGNDTMTGGTGEDTFSISPSTGIDTITDFVRGQDHLRLGFDMAMDLELPGNQGSGNTRLIEGQNLFIGDDPAALMNQSGMYNSYGIIRNVGQAALLFNTGTGLLSYDPDGRGAEAAIDLVRLDGVTTLSGADFYASYPV
ncbi:calcium-binding protein [Methylobacterium nonmethylotrophicum]|nr:calcium-binding protein [Methylobacterium nonmethylotrophicum]